MDVMWQEPAPQNHPLLDRDNVLITSHLARPELRCRSLAKPK